MKHLTEEQRKELEVLRRLGWTQQSIANEIGCCQPTVSRELKRNSSPKAGRYSSHQAQKRAESRRWYEKDPKLLEEVLEGLKNKRSPDQICGRRKLEQKPSVSFQTVYQFLKSDQCQGGKLFKLLRYQGKKFGIEYFR